MCYQVECNYCGKPTWSGCGRHIESALKNVSVDKRCQGWKDKNCPEKPVNSRE
eukprot:TRINITY_DN11684_c2_g1_i1.p1 TRINITY_DN11684_c2_g1~~TRINITY_DN11684_c2_g1_i1.p1  ORF type:complete len:53 (-),score=1.95 TRINITY_DN11684_c2_g1_i1:235-393(-)